MHDNVFSILYPRHLSIQHGELWRVDLIIIEHNQEQFGLDLFEVGSGIIVTGRLKVIKAIVRILLLMRSSGNALVPCVSSRFGRILFKLPYRIAGHNSNQRYYPRIRLRLLVIVSGQQSGSSGKIRIYSFIAKASQSRSASRGWKGSLLRRGSGGHERSAAPVMIAEQHHGPHQSRADTRASPCKTFTASYDRTILLIQEPFHSSIHAAPGVDGFFFAIVLEFDAFSGRSSVIATLGKREIGAFGARSIYPTTGRRHRLPQGAVLNLAGGLLGMFDEDPVGCLRFSQPVVTAVINRVAIQK